MVSSLGVEVVSPEYEDIRIMSQTSPDKDLRYLYLSLFKISVSNKHYLNAARIIGLYS
mgnify:CR=1 FL=1